MTHDSELHVMKSEERIRNQEAIAWLKSKSDTIDEDIPIMIEKCSIYGLEHVVKIIFSYIEIFAGAYKNSDDDVARVEFIKKYFGEINLKYRYLGGLFYTVYRHGLIHDFHPKRFDYNNIHYDWEVRRKEPEYHLSVRPKNNHPNQRIITISLQQLHSDLKKAVSRYLNDLEMDIDLQNNAGIKVNRIQARVEYKIGCKNRVTQDIEVKCKNLKIEVWEIELLKTISPKRRPYIEPSELDYLCSLEKSNT